MAKVPYSKIREKAETKIHAFEFKGETIEVRDWLPVQEKLALMGRIIEQAHDQDYHYMNPIKFEAFFCIEVVEAYTNITFTAKQKEDVPKLYDELIHSGLYFAIHECISEELDRLYSDIGIIAEKYYEYLQSLSATFDSMQNQYSEMDSTVTDIMSKLQDPESITLLKDITTKLG